MSDDKKLAIIATKGTLDWAYPPFILASTAAALGYETQIFFTFYGLQLLRKDLNLKVSPLGNPGMPMPMGMDKWFPVLGTALPGMEAVMTMMMKAKMKSKGVASVEELRELCIEADVGVFYNGFGLAERCAQKYELSGYSGGFHSLNIFVQCIYKYF